MSEFEDWLTYREVGLILLCAPKTVRNLVCLHRLPRVVVKVGRCRRLIARVPPETVRALARLLKTAPYLEQGPAPSVLSAARAPIPPNNPRL